jgi:ssDNA thymidine ADP-ribosyltransferase, DarT
VSAPPANPKIYHITHLENLPRIIDGIIWSDAERLRKAIECEVVGMSEIKRRRLEELEVDCHPGTMVGEYVPFYFCFRSVMLYLLHQGNHPDLMYRGGQSPIIHLEADLHRVVRWANDELRRWAFSKGNAGAQYTEFFKNLAQLDELQWEAINATNWRDPLVKEGKQAEFLLEYSFPWELVDRIGVFDQEMAGRLTAMLQGAQHRPRVVVARNWYY